MKKQTNYQAYVLEGFIPISLKMLVKNLLNSNLLATEQHTALQNFCTSYIAAYVFYYSLNTDNSCKHILLTLKRSNHTDLDKLNEAFI